MKDNSDDLQSGDKKEQYVVHEGSLYDYTAGTNCGVLVKLNIMKELAALQAIHLEKVKKLLTNGADSGDVFPSMWTLHHPNKVQTTVTFIDTKADIKDRIRSAVVSHKPKHKSLVFIAADMDEAKLMADSRHTAINY